MGTLLASIGRAFLSGVAVYLGVAACTAAVGSRQPGDGAGASGANGAPEGAETAGEGITDPVPEAKAQGVGASVAAERCDKTGTIGGAPYLYAVHHFPGKTLVELSAVRAVVHQASAASPPLSISGDGTFEHYVTTTQVRDGAVAAACAHGSATANDTVTFILPN